MRLVCPKCHAQLVISDQRVPSPGAWARCPRCRDRFYIHKPSENSSGEAARPTGSPLPARATEEGPAFSLAQITVFPEPASASWPTTAIRLLALAAVVAGATLLVKSAGDSRQWPTTPLAVFSQNFYGQDQLAADLRFLRKKYSGSRRGGDLISHEGPEIRVFRHYLGGRPPESGSDANRLILDAPVQEEGLRLAADCRTSPCSSASLSITWDGQEAVIRALESDRDYRINLYHARTAVKETGSEHAAGKGE